MSGQRIPLARLKEILRELDATMAIPDDDDAAAAIRAIPGVAAYDGNVRLANGHRLAPQYRPDADAPRGWRWRWWWRQ